MKITCDELLDFKAKFLANELLSEAGLRADNGVEEGKPGREQLEVTRDKKKGYITIKQLGANNYYIRIFDDGNYVAAKSMPALIKKETEIVGDIEVSKVFESLFQDCKGKIAAPALPAPAPAASASAGGDTPLLAPRFSRPRAPVGSPSGSVATPSVPAAAPSAPRVAPPAPAVPKGAASGAGSPPPASKPSTPVESLSVARKPIPVASQAPSAFRAAPEVKPVVSDTEKKIEEINELARKILSFYSKNEEEMLGLKPLGEEEGDFEIGKLEKGLYGSTQGKGIAISYENQCSLNFKNNELEIIGVDQKTVIFSTAKDFKLDLKNAEVIKVCFAEIDGEYFERQIASHIAAEMKRSKKLRAVAPAPVSSASAAAGGPRSRMSDDEQPGAAPTRLLGKPEPAFVSGPFDEPALGLAALLCGSVELRGGSEIIELDSLEKSLPLPPQPQPSPSPAASPLPAPIAPSTPRPGASSPQHGEDSSSFSDGSEESPSRFVPPPPPPPPVSEVLSLRSPELFERKKPEEPRLGGADEEIGQEMRRLIDTALKQERLERKSVHTEADKSSIEELRREKISGVSQMVAKTREDGRSILKKIKEEAVKLLKEENQNALREPAMFSQPPVVSARSSAPASASSASPVASAAAAASPGSDEKFDKRSIAEMVEKKGKEEVIGILTEKFGKYFQEIDASAKNKAANPESYKAALDQKATLAAAVKYSGKFDLEEVRQICERKKPSPSPASAPSASRIVFAAAAVTP